MFNFAQKHMDELYKIENFLGCSVLLPPSKEKKMSPFIHLKDYRELGGDVRIITRYLSECGFSFYFKDPDFIIVIGKFNEPGCF